MDQIVGWGGLLLELLTLIVAWYAADVWRSKMKAEVSLPLAGKLLRRIFDLTNAIQKLRGMRESKLGEDPHASVRAELESLGKELARLQRLFIKGRAYWGPDFHEASKDFCTLVNEFQRAARWEGNPGAIAARYGDGPEGHLEWLAIRYDLSLTKGKDDWSLRLNEAIKRLESFLEDSMPTRLKS